MLQMVISGPNEPRIHMLVMVRYASLRLYTERDEAIRGAGGEDRERRDEYVGLRGRYLPALHVKHDAVEGMLCVVCEKHASPLRMSTPCQYHNATLSHTHTRTLCQGCVGVMGLILGPFRPRRLFVKSSGPRGRRHRFRRVALIQIGQARCPCSGIPLEGHRTTVVWQVGRTRLLLDRDYHVLEALRLTFGAHLVDEFVSLHRGEAGQRQRPV